MAVQRIGGTSVWTTTSVPGAAIPPVFAPGSFKLRWGRAAAAWKISIEHFFKLIEFRLITAILDYVRKLFFHGLGQDPAQGGNDWRFAAV